ncbi:hypothetical protein M408DRAFT_80279 [Serendipita vermifera MAFF 305830]|uniref:Uncharacterized protein n=1 Tax=Serendipita vermifera MAFF 305830 TaxID=933852 RepID=A0A0C3AAK5_SERVB|nr:hypothetical protein M408DRAFT_80279 [Serendipita vermifera MAFF 305830]
MLILILAYHLIQGVQSEADPIWVAIEPRDGDLCDREIGQRSVWIIIWSCLTTIFLCTWVAAHPNHWTEEWLWDPLHEIVTYKLPLFLWALIVPEYILAWAVQQYLQAGRMLTIWIVSGWTRTHGHFVIMGGFHLFRLPADTPSIPLRFKSLRPSNFIIPIGYHSRKDEIPVCPLKFEDFPVELLEIIAPTEIELKDRGKSDSLTKGIALLQTLWFVIQCIARGTRQLPLTELEVVTLAYATLNLFIYLFWWDKPRNVECPIRVYKAVGHNKPGRQLQSVEGNQNWAWRWMEKAMAYVLITQDDSVVISEQHSIPMFWSGRLEHDLRASAGFEGSVLGSIFGGVYCITWSSQFPSNVELVLCVFPASP